MDTLELLRSAATRNFIWGYINLLPPPAQAHFGMTFTYTEILKYNKMIKLNYLFTVIFSLHSINRVLFFY